MYKQKYLKYKQKFLELKNLMKGGTHATESSEEKISRFNKILDKIPTKLVKRRLGKEIITNLDFYINININDNDKIIILTSNNYIFNIPYTYPFHPPRIEIIPKYSNKSALVEILNAQEWYPGSSLYTHIQTFEENNVMISPSTHSSETRIIVVGRVLYQIVSNDIKNMFRDKNFESISQEIKENNIKLFSKNIINKLIENNFYININIIIDVYDSYDSRLEQFNNRSFKTDDGSKQITFNFHNKNFYISNVEIPRFDYIFLDYSTFKFLNVHDEKKFTSYYSFFYYIYKKLNDGGFLFTYGGDGLVPLMREEGFKIVNKLFKIDSSNCNYLPHYYGQIAKSKGGVGCYTFTKINDQNIYLSELILEHNKQYEDTKTRYSQRKDDINIDFI
tara:strand:- start:3249 stop:4421 length:1173 start_codon:yes stop_codon:yes gene_type:complete